MHYNCCDDEQLLWEIKVIRHDIRHGIFGVAASKHKELIGLIEEEVIGRGLGGKYYIALCTALRLNPDEVASVGQVSLAPTYRRIEALIKMLLSSGPRDYIEHYDSSGRKIGLPR